MKKNIVLISGALATTKFWSKFIKSNHKKNDCVFHHIDLLGCDSITKIARRFINIAPEKFTLVGFSMGGYVALELFRYMPKKIEKLVLINSSAKAISEEALSERKRSLELIKRGKFDFLIKLIFRQSILDKNQNNILFLMQEMAKDVGVENYIDQLNAIIKKPDQTSLLSTIKCPTLIIGAKQDQIMPFERSRHLAENISSSKLVCLNNCGHLAILEQSDIVNSIIFNWI